MGGSPAGGAGGGAAYQGLVQASYTPYVPQPPTVTGLSKNIGRPGGGETITITGTNFTNGVSSVRFGTINAASFSVNSATQITAVTPQHSLGTFNVIVTNVDGTSPSTSANQFTFKARGGFNSAMMGM
nr:IPT/TIG domain-containing protein [Bradyrhizobium sp. 2S1]